MVATPFAEGVCNDGLESRIRRRASRAARFARSRAPLVQNVKTKTGDTASNGQTKEKYALKSMGKKTKKNIIFYQIFVENIGQAPKMTPGDAQSEKMDPQGEQK